MRKPAKRKRKTAKRKLPPAKVVRDPHVQRHAVNWCYKYGLTLTEADVFLDLAHGVPRLHLIRVKGIAPVTLKVHVHNILRKLGDDSVDAAIVRLLRGVVTGAQ